MEDRWLSVDEIAGHLGIKRDTVYKWIRERRHNAPDKKKRAYFAIDDLPDNRPEEARVKVEEDYQVCARMLTRDEGKGQRRKAKIRW